MHSMRGIYWKCREEAGAFLRAIPHNPNLSNGQMFHIEYPEGSTLAEQAALASLRARMEPVVEMMQQKGESECRSGMWKVLGNDEDCDFEKLRSPEVVPARRNAHTKPIATPTIPLSVEAPNE